MGAATEKTRLADEDEIQVALLARARDLLDKHESQDALLPLEKVIEYHEAHNRSPDRLVFSARTADERALYQRVADMTNIPIAIFNANWVTAYERKGYALLELGQIPEAGEALERAKALAPSNSVVLSELGYFYMLDKQPDRSLESYKSAEEAAVVSPAFESTRDLGRALRGQGFALAELGRLDDAESRFRRCLDIDADDALATKGMWHVARLRAMPKS